MTKILIFILTLLLTIIKINSRGSQSMINGVPSDHRSFMVSIRVRIWEDPFGSGHICGGTIITFNLVLTAASCFRYPPISELNAADVLIIAGTNMRYNQTAAFTLNAREIFIHPNYNTNNRSHNIALVETLEMPRNAVNIQPIDLRTETPIAGDECQIYGFGQAGTLTGPSQLSLGRIQIVDNSACHDHRLSIFCSNSNTFPCNGDEGGPLICDNHLVGIIDHIDIDHCRRSVDLPRTSYINIIEYHTWISIHLMRLEIYDEDQRSSASKFSKFFSVVIVLMMCFNYALLAIN